MRPVAFFLLSSLVAASAVAEVRVSRDTRGTIDVRASGEPFSSTLRALKPWLREDVAMAVASDPRITISTHGLTPMATLRAVVARAGLSLRREGSRYWIENMQAANVVTLDVKDADIRVVLKSMQTQCGIRNLILDRDVGGTGTFLFRGLPCRTAFDVVMRSAGLAVSSYSEAVIEAGRQH